MNVHDRPKVSVCIANYNGMGVLDACLRSVQSQTCTFSVEIIVHDDASTDGSAAHIRETYPDVVLIESHENVGFCISNNRMAQAARGEYFLLLNNDAELFPDALCCLRRAATNLDRPAILGLPQYNADSGELIDMGSHFDPFLNPIPNLDKTRSEVGMVIGACLWVPRSLWWEIGGFPDWFGSMAEDMYLCCVARLWGYPVLTLRESGFRHWVGRSFGGGKVEPGGQLKTSFKRRELSERNKSFVMVTTYPPLLFQAIFPVHVVLLLAEGALLSLFKRDIRLWKRIYIGCIAALWRERSRLRIVRAQVQAKRRQRYWDFLKVFSPLPHKIRVLLRYGMPKIS
jgi:hypothetical protein